MTEAPPLEFNYVLVTPARNEAPLIEHPLRSVTAQTTLPLRWVIVSDGSSDGTDDIVQAYAERHPFIRLIRRNGKGPRDFASKVEALRLGLEQLSETRTELLGFLDADVSFEATYFREVLNMFALDQALGIAGGQYYEKERGRWKAVPTAAAWSVSGGVQMFRRRCYDEIGGYVPREQGGIDTVAEVMARQCGWKVKTNTSLKVQHHRAIGTASQGVLRARFREGWQEYTIGYDPAFAVAKTFGRLAQHPWVLGSAARMCGFLTAWMVTRRPTVPESLVRFLRTEQRRRLSGCLLARGGEKGSR